MARRLIPLRALVLGLVVLAGPALAASCLPSCDVTGALVAFAPPVTLVASGGTVSWTAADVPHTATADDGSRCFNAPFTARSPHSATFTLRDGALYAKVGLTEKGCTGARALEDGSFVLPYVCLYHRSMTGDLVVQPEAVA